MKQEFSKSWVGSSQVRKQRKYRANAPLHVKRKMISGHLNKELNKKYGKRSFPIVKGDEVKIMKGSFKGKEGKISVVDTKRGRVAVENIQRKKKDGTKINVWFDGSNLQIQTLKLDDKKRVKRLGNKTEKEVKKEAVKKKEEKPKSTKVKNVHNKANNK